MRKQKCWLGVAIIAIGVLNMVNLYLSPHNTSNNLNLYGSIIGIYVSILAGIDICKSHFTGKLLRSLPLAIRLAGFLLFAALTCLDLRTGMINVMTLATAALGGFSALMFLFPSIGETSRYRKSRE